MTDRDAPKPYYLIGLFVTGEGEQEFLPNFLGRIAERGRSAFTVVRKIEQRAPITSPKRTQKMVGSGKVIPTLDEELGLDVRTFLFANSGDVGRLAIVVDDLEKDSRNVVAEKFERYRKAIDTMVRSDEDRRRASVHFFANMVEAYFFAHPDAVNQALGTTLSPHDGDVEEIGHPKGELKRLYAGYDEKADGARIVRHFDLRVALNDPSTCGFLRSLVKWCVQSTEGIAASETDDFQLREGIVAEVTGRQV